MRKSEIMRACLLVSLGLFVAAFTASNAFADSFDSGGDRLAALQNDDGGWDWDPADDGNPASPSPLNTVGPIGMGLAQAYLNTGEHLSSLTSAGALLLSKTNNFSPSDGYLAATLDEIFSVTTYTDHVTANFYDPLAAGTYDRNGVDTNYDTAGYVASILASRTSQGIGNLGAWDVGMGLYAAAMAGADTTEWILGTQTAVNNLDGNGYYDVIGLAGALLGLSSVGADFDPTAGEHATASNLGDLANVLASYQLSTGGFAWNSNYVIEGDNNETVQETAYAILALSQYDAAGYSNEILAAQAYLISIQLPTGGWENYLGSGENNEITGEALWALNAPVPEPATMTLLGIGLAGMAATQWRRRVS
ncbi:MAG: PEP-CTERM sorting domain-containing protein [Candidatus Hydrogenedentes bacterium]|nr:PEP-CTERM sorting domain-containing protein [Candidatus Hydrogenedentota bacterium]